MRNKLTGSFRMTIGNGIFKAIPDLDCPGTWIFLAPVSHLLLTEAVNFEYRVDRVTFIAAHRLARRRRRLGLPDTLGNIKKYSQSLEELFNPNVTFAHMRLKGQGSNLENKFIHTVSEEIAILSLSQLGYASIRQIAPLKLETEHLDRISYLLLNANNSYWGSNSPLSGKFKTLSLDRRWKDFQNFFFFTNLAKVLQRRIPVKNSWRRELRNAAIIAGQGLCSPDISQSLLWSVIALETLLTKRGDKISRRLPERVEAFIGWTKDWELENFWDRLQDIYNKRCEFVHRGDRDAITVEDVEFSFDILMNVLSNVMRNLKLFPSKEAIISFSERVQAGNTPEIKPKIRPKTLGFARRIRENAVPQ